jgi:hypothetical protein
VLEGILKPFPDADLSVLVVWIVLKATDTPEAANEASAKFSDTRVTQFFDPGQMAEVAWDFYLFYPPAVQWEELPPEPQAWMHQLPGGWADKEHLFKRKTLTKKLAGTMKSLFA